jgi:hypothetical protein
VLKNEFGKVQLMKSPNRRSRKPSQRKQATAPKFEQQIIGFLSSKLEQRQSAESRPAQQKQLDEIWPAWHALPARMSAEERQQILTDPLTTEHKALLRKLRRRFDFLPVDRYEYSACFSLLELWFELRRYADTTTRLHMARVSAQLSYDTFDDVLTGRVAIFRTMNELAYLRPKFFDLTPTIETIEHLQSRYTAYIRARMDAIKLLNRVAYPQKLTPAAALPLKKRAFGTSRPPENFPEHLQIARLAPVGKCSPERLADFMANKFLELNRPEQNAFLDEYHRPTVGRAEYVFLPVWLAENAPVFEAFALRWPEIHKEVQQRFNRDAPEHYRTCPETADNLKTWWKIQVENKNWPGEPRRINAEPGNPGKPRSVPPGLLTPLTFVSSQPKP